jgi:serine protease Do
MLRPLLIIALAAVCFTPAFGQTRDEKVRGDREAFDGDGQWIYNDLDAAFAEARKTGKPLLVVFRCVPCEACAQLDADVAERDPLVRPLLDQYVCVRVVHANALDLSLFQFDFDQSWAALMMNADKTIYGRYGTRSHQTESEDDVSLEGFADALWLALALHRNVDRYREALSAKRGEAPPFATPEESNMLRGKYGKKLDWDGKVAQSCIHCHQVGEALRHDFRTQGQPIPTQVLFPHPHPKALGLIVDPKTATTLQEVTPGSAAERSGFRAGDRLVTLAGQPLVSMADIQWVLHHTGDTAELPVRVLRNDKQVDLTLRLAKGWREADDISWRATSWDLRRMTTGGILFHELSEEEREKAGIEPGRLALRAQHVGQYGEHAAAKRAGFQKDDILVEINGRSDLTRETDVIHWLATTTKRGDQLPATVLRNGREIQLKLPMQ